MAERLHQFETSASSSSAIRPPKAALPPKPPLATKPTIPPKPAPPAAASITQPRQSSVPVAPPRPKLAAKAKKDHGGDIVERKEQTSEVYISPVAAPLDPAMDAGVPEQPRLRRREQKRQKDAARDAEVLAELKAICTDADPTKLYRNMVKIGQG